jgi:hypothetical protein
MRIYLPMALQQPYHSPENMLLEVQKAEKGDLERF